MMSFKEFIHLLEKHELPFDHSTNHGWWEDKDHIYAYHGTHKKHVASILRNGLDRVDDKTNKISVTMDPHTAHGYAAMSGESNFRKAGGRAVHVPHEDRRVLKMKIPKKWLKDNMDNEMRGNIGSATGKLSDRKHYDKWRKDNPKKSDHEYYMTSEFRTNPVPAHFITGVMKKNNT